MKRLAIAAAIIVGLSARPAHASGHVVAPSTGTFYGIGFLLVLAAIAPSEFGALLPAHGASNGATFDLGWSWQIPAPIGDTLSDRHHRIVIGVDYFPTTTDTRIDARFGYRYDRRHLFAGVAAASDNGNFIWSPELGVKLVNFADRNADLSPSLHLSVRANVAPEVNAIRSVTILLGWSVI